MGRGVTLLRGEGGWSGSGRNVLLVAFRQRQIVALKRTVSEIDPEAFLIVCPAHEVLGNGFRRHGADGLRARAAARLLPFPAVSFTSRRRACPPAQGGSLCRKRNSAFPPCAPC